MLLELLTSPKTAAFVVATLYGRPDLADDLVDICHRESRCSNIGPHEIDRHLSNREWHGQVKWGHLNPSCQPRSAPRS